MQEATPLKIIIVEDEALLQLEYAQAIGEAFSGAQIFPLTDSRALAETHRTQGADIILTDLVMDSQHEGIAGLSSIREFDKDVPIIVISGRPDFTSLAEMFDVQKVLLKPVDVRTIIRVISRVTNRPAAKEIGGC